MDENLQLLFEDLYPRFDFPGGTLEWVSEEEARVYWGTQSTLLRFDDFPQNHLTTYHLVEWVYKNMEVLPSEMDDTYVFWDYNADQFFLETVRGQDIIYKQATTHPYQYKNYGDVSKFDFRLVGNLLHVSSLEEGVSPLCALSHPITFHDELSRYFDITDKMYMMIPLNAWSRDAKHHKVIIGFKDSLERLREDYDIQDFETIPLSKYEEGLNQHLKDSERAHE